MASYGTYDANVSLSLPASATEYVVIGIGNEDRRRAPSRCDGMPLLENPRDGQPYDADANKDQRRVHTSSSDGEIKEGKNLTQRYIVSDL